MNKIIKRTLGDLPNNVWNNWVRNDEVYLELDQDNGITITDAENGKFQIDEQIINIAAGNYKYDIRITFSDGNVKTWIKGDFLVICNITQ